MLRIAGRTAARGVTAARPLRIKRLGVTLVAIAALLAFAVPSSYARTRALAGSGTCSYANGSVTATGLPTGVVINFMEVDNTTGSQTGWVLGISDNGNWSVDVTPPVSSTTYEFVSKTYGPDGSHFTVYASCTAG